MKKSVAMKWVNALRSGKYNQINMKLQDSTAKTSCCPLGVLCLVNRKKVHYENVDKLLSKPESKSFIWGLNDSGFENEPDFSNNSHYGRITYTRMNFDEIADIIQLLYKEL